MKKAKRVRIAAEIYHEGSPSWEFNVSGFNAASYVPEAVRTAPPVSKTMRRVGCNPRDPQCVTGAPEKIP
jgi:hypothetical protein